MSALYDRIRNAAVGTPVESEMLQLRRPLRALSGAVLQCCAGGCQPVPAWLSPSPRHWLSASQHLPFPAHTVGLACSHCTLTKSRNEPNEYGCSCARFGALQNCTCWYHVLRCTVTCSTARYARCVGHPLRKILFPGCAWTVLQVAKDETARV